jgi:hypothetical protein
VGPWGQPRAPGTGSGGGDFSLGIYLREGEGDRHTKATAKGEREERREKGEASHTREK